MVDCAETCLLRVLTPSYEDCINGVAERLPVFYHKIDNPAWAEIDTPGHLQRVERIVLPRLGNAWEALTGDGAERGIRAECVGACETW